MCLLHRGLNVPGEQREQKSVPLQNPSMQPLQFSLAVCVCVCVCACMEEMQFFDNSGTALTHIERNFT